MTALVLLSDCVIVQSLVVTSLVCRCITHSPCGKFNPLVNSTSCQTSVTLSLKTTVSILESVAASSINSILKSLLFTQSSASTNTSPMQPSIHSNGAACLLSIYTLTYRGSGGNRSWARIRKHRPTASWRNLLFVDKNWVIHVRILRVVQDTTNRQDLFPWEDPSHLSEVRQRIIT